MQKEATVMIKRIELMQRITKADIAKEKKRAEITVPETTRKQMKTSNPIDRAIGPLIRVKEIGIKKEEIVIEMETVLHLLVETIHSRIQQNNQNSSHQIKTNS